MTPQRILLTLKVFFAMLVTPALVHAQDDPLPSPYFPDPVFVQLKTKSFNTETIDRIYDMGFRGFRRGIYWDEVDKGDGTYDFSAWDKEFKHAHDKGMRIIGCFFGNNKKYEDDGIGGIQTEEGRQAFAKFAAAAAEHYKDYDIIWEIWNEPNVRTFWRKNKKPVGDVPTAMHNSQEFADEYSALVKEVAKEMKKADPDAIIAAGSVSNYWKPSYKWTEACFKNGVLDSGVTVWSVHPYGVKRPEDFTEGHEITRDLLKKYGHPEMPMLNTERGFAIKEHQGGGEVANEGWSGGPAEKAEIFQAWHYVRQFMMDQMHGLRLTTWYEVGGDKFGLIKNRPVVTAAKVMNQQLKGYKYVKRLDSGNELDYVLLWENRDGGQKLVAWTAPPPKETPDKAEAREVTISGLSGDVPVVDIAGKELTASGNPTKFKISGSPIYIEVPTGKRPGSVQVAAR
ncbi:MAG: cellulase family glycosylhydrolase [Verrucomicrobiota bacterium]